MKSRIAMKDILNSDKETIACEATISALLILKKINPKLLTIKNFNFLNIIDLDEHQKILLAGILAITDMLKYTIFLAPDQIPQIPLNIENIEKTVLETIPSNNLLKNCFFTIKLTLGDQRLYTRSDFFAIVKVITEVLLLKPNSSTFITPIVEACLELRNVNTENFCRLISSLAHNDILRDHFFYSRFALTGMEYYDRGIRILDMHQKKMSSQSNDNNKIRTLSIFKCRDESPFSFAHTFFKESDQTAQLEKIALELDVFPKQDNYGKKAYDAYFRFK